MSVYRLSELSGLNQSTLANTFSRGTVPSLNNLEAMCSAMGVTLAQFFTEGESEQLLTSDEAKLLYHYRKLPDNVKKSFLQLAETCSIRNE